MRIAVFLIMLSAIAQVEAEQRVALPDNYRETFTEYLSSDRMQNPDQFIRIFANQAAMRGKDSTGALPEGSVLVAEVYSVKKNAQGEVLTSVLQRRIKDQFKLVAVMEKQAAFGEKPVSLIPTGNWDFAAYTPEGKAAPKNLEECRACHSPLTGSDFVFSIEHLPMVAAEPAVK